MDDDTAMTPSGAPDIEARLRQALAQRAGGTPVTAANWGDLAGRLAAATRRRQRLLAGAAALALVVGAAGGYFGEAAASTGTTASRAGAGPVSSTTVVGGKASPSVAAPGTATICPGGAGTGGEVGSATKVFSRTTADGVTVRVYRLAPSGSPCVPSPSAPVAGGSTDPSPATTLAPNLPVSPGSPGSTGTTTTEVSPYVSVGPSFSIELSDDSAVGQGVVSSPVCVGSPAAGAGTGIGAASGSAGGTSTGPAETAPEPVTVPGSILPPVTTIVPPVTTTTAPTGGGNAAQEPQQLSAGAFGVVEGDPVWWVAVEVGSDVASVRMTFADGSVDQMAPVDGIAVVAHRVSAATASTGTGPYDVRGTLDLLGADGGTVATAGLPQTPPPTPTPTPTPVPVPLHSVAPGTAVPGGTGSTIPGGTSSGSASSGSASSGSVSSGSVSPIVVCPQPSSTTAP
ncbi:MAG TPA: hypothetical protein VMV22_06745 [Acidimicrobiales bacterium]|nr:hypothetical protein [Acidimicrobiales bacterium]